MDARAEIEAKRERLARLREQRQRLAAGTPMKSPSPDLVTPPVEQPAQEAVLPAPSVESPKPKLTSVTSTIYSTEPVIYYSKSTQTENIPEEPELEESFSEISLIDAVEPVVTVKTIDTQRPASPEFTLATESPEDARDAIEFLDRAWRIVARIKDIDDPTKGAFDSASAGTIQHVRCLQSLCGPASPVASIEWHPQHSDIIAVSYREISDSGNNASHIYVWSIRTPSEPEYTLLSGTDIGSVQFGLSNSQAVFGGGFNGRVLAWDLRQGQFELLPFQRSADDEGHAFPVRALALTGTNLISCAEDGSFCVWAQDLLTRPQTKLQLTANTTASLDGLGPSAPTALAVHPCDNTQFIVGTLDGSLYHGFRVDSVTTRAGIRGEAFTDGHAAGITCLHFRQAARGTASMAYMLSGSLDWTIRLWRVGLDGSSSHLVTLFVDDIVSDLAWAPDHPSLFAAACQNSLQIWDLNKSVDLPVATVKFPWLVSRVAWSCAQKLAVGGVSGEVQICEVDDDLSEPDELGWSKFNEKFK